MPKYKILRRRDGLSIDIHDAAGSQAQILGALQECKEGRCSCPSPEYEKLASMDVATTTDTVQVELTTKPGVSLAEDAVRNCLDFTMARLDDKRPSGEGSST